MTTMQKWHDAWHKMYPYKVVIVYIDNERSDSIYDGVRTIMRDDDYWLLHFMDDRTMSILRLDVLRLERHPTKGDDNGRQI